MKFIKFTDPAGSDVWIVSQWVTKVYYPVRGQFPQGARAVIAMGVNVQAVVQTPDEVVRLLEEE